MTKEEILKEINYHGKYTNEVKRRLNKLLKKYHPDNNKSDQKTILVLYEIKKELEEGKIEYTPDTNESKASSGNNIFFFESMLERFKKEKEKINRKINALYKKLNSLNISKNKKQDELYGVEKNILNLNDEIENIFSITLLDIILIIIIILSILGFIIFKNILFIGFVIVLVLLELYYVYNRYLDYNDKLNRMSKVKKKHKSIMEEYKVLEGNIKSLEKEEVKLKKERNKINNSIQFYSHQISLVRNGDYERENTYERRGK